MQSSLSAEGLYINDFHRENSMAAQRAVKQMSLHPYSREQKIAQIQMLRRLSIMADLYEYSTPELVRLLGSRFKEYRMRCNLTQKEVAEQSGIGLTTIHKFENGTAGNLSLSTFVLLLRVVGQVNALDDVLPELPESPYLVRREEKKAQRIRHTNKK